MADFARLQVIGRLGADPEKNEDREYSTFSVAVTDKDNTTWWRFMVYGHNRDFAVKYLHKGDQVFVVAKPHKDIVDGDGGKKVYERNNVETLIKLSNKGDNQDQNPF